MRARISITQNFAKAFGLLDDSEVPTTGTHSTPEQNINIQTTETHHSSAVPQDQPIFSVSTETEPVKVNVQKITAEEKLWVDEEIDHNLTCLFIEIFFCRWYNLNCIDKDIAQTYMLKYQQLRVCYAVQNLLHTFFYNFIAASD